MRRTKVTWEKTAEGIWAPIGSVTDNWNAATLSSSEFRENAQSITRLYGDSNITIPTESDLALLIRSANELSEKWRPNEPIPGDLSELLFRALHLNRIAIALEPLRHFSGRSKYLSDLIGGTLDFFDRTPSHAKDTFWEIEFWSSLLKQANTAKLIDPPDIVVQWKNHSLGIACKKFYSEKHVQNKMSEAVRQIANTYDIGIVAINIDDLAPSDKYLQRPDQSTLQSTLIAMNRKFLSDHERHFRRYLSTLRCCCVVVSTALIADVKTGSPKLGNATQRTAWMIPDVDSRKRAVIKELFDVATI